MVKKAANCLKEAVESIRTERSVLEQSIKLVTVLQKLQPPPVLPNALTLPLSNHTRLFQKSGNGVFATTSFRSDQKVIEVPEELMITAGKVADMETYSKLLKDSKFFPTPFELLTLFFCVEDEESSLYGPYLKALPKSKETFKSPGKE
ncbi:hypothetical protein TELCIR_09143 [Teladorsagia circumcincta]|uniref:Uncharacterized protein n=1 Tax=Teladorsagia circumcincta TaxID=45464 RepID=A0A2G9UFM3_TELCI|nr:hypothetical protein TELCIR_09143 [Teladorsagia circumcincta]